MSVSNTSVGRGSGAAIVLLLLPLCHRACHAAVVSAPPLFPLSPLYQLVLSAPASPFLLNTTLNGYVLRRGGERGEALLSSLF